jgi:hypothetical protein
MGLGDIFGSAAKAVGGGVQKVADVAWEGTGHIPVLGEVLHGTSKTIVGAGKGAEIVATNPTQVARGLGAAQRYVREHPGQVASAVGHYAWEQITDPQEIAMNVSLGMLTGGAGWVAKGAEAARAAETIGDISRAGRTKSFLNSVDTALEAPTRQWRRARGAVGMNPVGFTQRQRGKLAKKVAGEQPGAARQIMADIVSASPTRPTGEAAQGVRGTIWRAQRIKSQMLAPEKAQVGVEAMRTVEDPTRLARNEQVQQAALEAAQSPTGQQAISRASQQVGKSALRPEAETAETRPWQQQPTVYGDLTQPAPRLQTGDDMSYGPRSPRRGHYDETGAVDITAAGKAARMMGRGAWRGAKKVGRKMTDDTGEHWWDPTFYKGRSEFSGVTSTWDWRDLSRPGIKPGKSRNRQRAEQAERNGARGVGGGTFNINYGTNFGQIGGEGNVGIWANGAKGFHPGEQVEQERTVAYAGPRRALGQGSNEVIDVSGSEAETAEPGTVFAMPAAPSNVSKAQVDLAATPSKRRPAGANLSRIDLSNPEIPSSEGAAGRAGWRTASEEEVAGGIRPEEGFYVSPSRVTEPTGESSWTKGYVMTNRPLGG